MKITADAAVSCPQSALVRQIRGTSEVYILYKERGECCWTGFFEEGGGWALGSSLRHSYIGKHFK